MPIESRVSFLTEQDVQFDAMGLQRLASEMSAADALKSYHGMIERYVQNEQPAFARSLRDKVADLWKGLSPEEQTVLETINATIEDEE